MQLYYQENITKPQFVLSDKVTHHLINVLRHTTEKPFLLTNGKGKIYTCLLQTVSKKECIATIINEQINPQTPSLLHLAIAFTKNASRMEWLLEKCTEIGIASITPLITHRTEKIFIKQDRFSQIIISAMCQSQQSYLPQLNAPIEFQKIIQKEQYEQKFIAHCIPHISRHSLQSFIQDSKKSTLICIGPEGDFTEDEVTLAIKKSAKSITLGNKRLRTETAGVVACTLYNACVD